MNKRDSEATKDYRKTMTNEVGRSSTNWFFETRDACISFLGDKAVGPKGASWCNGTWDSVLCWPATENGTWTKLNCPPFRGLDPKQFAYKRCGEDGHWEGEFPGDYSLPHGWTNYTGCYTTYARKQYDKFYGNKQEWEVQLMKDSVLATRTLEMVGLSLSLVTLIVSIVIFCYYRCLRNNRTRIHRHLFIAVIVEVLVRLTIYVDQYFSKSGAVRDGHIGNLPVLCELLYAVMEYTNTVKFMWMLIEGMYLHNMVVMSVFSSGEPNYLLYYFIGWGIPVPITTAWALTNVFLHKETCWWGYNFLPFYWVIEGPRSAVIATNVVFLLNIIRVLVTKLRSSNSNEASQVRKAVKAAIILLPLLGITNFIQMIPEPTDSSIAFCIWSISSHFVISFQGFFIAMIYCFLNGEVRQAIGTHIERRRLMSSHQYSTARRTRFSIFTSVTEMPKNRKRKDRIVNSTPMPNGVDI